LSDTGPNPYEYLGPPESAADATPTLELPATFRTSLGMRIFIYVGAAALCGLFLYVGFVMPFVEEKSRPVWGILLLMLFALGMNALFIAGIINVHRQRLVIKRDCLEFREWVKVRRLPLGEIEGYRVVPQAGSIWIYPKGGGKPIKPGHMERSAELRGWIAANLVDLNAGDAEREVKEILADDGLGLSEEERRFALARARGWCRLLNGAGVALTLWAFFYPRPYPYLMLALVVMPALAIFALHALKGAVRFDAPKHSAYPTTALAFLMPPLALFLRAFLDWRLLDWGRTALIAAPLALLLAGAILAASKRSRSKWHEILAVLLIASAYAFGVTVQANCLLDDADAERHAVTVLVKRASGGKATTYYLKVTAWGDRAEGEEVQASRRQYERAEAGSRAAVYVMPGALGVKWYEVVVDPAGTEAGDG
jgi:hypothetical protein